MFGNIEVTIREVFIGLLGAVLLCSIGFFIATSIHNGVTEANEPYLRALKVDKDVDLFDHALNTNVGYTLSEGYLETPKPVKNSNIKGEYLSIIEIEEHYVMKTRVVTETVNGKTRTRTETYWVWEEVGRNRQDASTFTFLGKEFSTNLIKLSMHRQTNTVSKGIISDVRYIYKTIPTSFNTSLFFKTSEKTLSKTALYPNKTIKQVVEMKENAADKSVTVFWVSWIMVILIGVFVFVAMENRFLNDLGKTSSRGYSYGRRSK